MSRILWLHPRGLLPARGGGDIRTLGLINLALDDGHQVLLLHPGKGERAHRSGLDIRELDLLQGTRKFVAQLLPPLPLRAPAVTPASVRDARVSIQRFDPQVCVVSEIMSCSLAKQLLPDRPWIYDAHNVEHELFHSHRAAARTLYDRATYSTDYRRVKRAERHMVTAADAVLAVSPVDAMSLEILAPGAEIAVVPNSVSTPEASGSPGSAPPVVLFVGTLDYPPNVDAISELVESVMPIVRDRCPEARLVVAGRRPPPTLTALLRSASWVDVLEDVPDLAPVYRSARCVVLPLRYGSGTNIKLFEALSFGVPVVATPKATEGIAIRPGHDVLVRGDAAGLADATIALMTDPDHANQLGAEGRRTFVDRLSWQQASARPFARVLRKVANDDYGLSTGRSIDE